MRKRTIIFLLILITLVGCNSITDKNSIDPPGKNPDDNNSYVEADTTEVFNNIEGLAQNSPTVIIGQVKSESVKFDYRGLNFYKSEIKIKDILRNFGDKLAKNSTITLLQNDLGDIDPLVKKNEKVLLFLKKYEGPVIDDAYRIVGLYQGHYKVKDGKLVSLANKNSKLFNSSNGVSFSSLDKVLNNNPFKPMKSKVMSEEEIQQGNNEEKELEKQLRNN